MTPFYGRLPNVPGVGVERVADIFGAARGRRAPPPASLAHAAATGLYQIRARRQAHALATTASEPSPSDSESDAMTTTKVVVDPLTRIEGHLRIEAQAENGRITNAWATSTQFRGIEIVMQGRDPRDAWAFAQRICGVCTVVHAVASCRAVEDALDIRIPANANAHPQPGHCDAVRAGPRHALLPPARTRLGGRRERAVGGSGRRRRRSPQSISPWPNNSPDVLQRGPAARQDSSSGAANSGSSPTATGAIPRTSCPPEVNLLAVAHYLEALDWQRDVIRLHTIFGGKNPHPNFLVGGHGVGDQPRRRRTTINAGRLAQIHDMIGRAQQFVEQVYWPDLVAIAGFYKEWGSRSGAARATISPSASSPMATCGTSSTLYFPRGIISPRGPEPTSSRTTRPASQEYIHSSWYDYPGGNRAGLHPYDGETKPNYTGRQAALDLSPGREEVHAG